MKKILYVIILSLVMLFASCNQGGDTTTTSSGQSFVSGSQALSFDFEENMPPESIKDQGLRTFTTRLKLLNEGEFDIPVDTAFLKLGNIDPAEFNLTSVVRPIPALRGYKKQGDKIISPTPTYVMFPNMKYVGDIGAGSQTRTIHAYACYPYETNAIGLLCVDPNPLIVYEEGIKNCEAEGAKDIDYSGGPLSVEQLEQFPSGEHSIEFQFEIAKVAGGDLNIYTSGSIDNECSIQGNSLNSAEVLNYINRVEYTVDSGSVPINCEQTGTNTNTVELAGDRYLVTCSLDTENQVERDTPIKINLKYDVVDRVSTDINIEHVFR